MIVKDNFLTKRQTFEEVEIGIDSSHEILCVHVRHAAKLLPSFCQRNKKSPLCRCSGLLLNNMNTKSGFLRLLAVIENENSIERTPFS
ncbi:hypothetical protein TNCV_3577961 [Trichonephila clavipes]|uniref:Uncharacterized protein n=1 Tax=Trichonephila clavipes TaxID=2585209 RepID=A0A8X6UTH6_TRICX|nr:hypothetical protein TNCV_3577961 [Trichonephila clavipes]